MRGAGRAVFAAILLLVAVAGKTFGRVIGIIAGTLGAIGALLSIGGSNPWWSLAVFFICVWIVYGIVVLGDDEPAIAS